MKLKELQTETTALILECLEKGTPPWQSDCTIDYPRNAVSQRYFTGSNIFILMAVTMRRGFTSNQWLTFNQIKKLGGRIIGDTKAERQASAYVLEPRTRRYTDKNGEEQVYQTFVGSARWNLDQVSGIAIDATTAHAADVAADMAATDQWIESAGARLVRTRPIPSYSPSADDISMPAHRMFKTAEGYFATGAHELVHWTGHKSRNDRDFAARGKLAYAFEELVAELGAAMLCARSGVGYSVENHAAYIGSWKTILKGDDTAIFRAAEHATKAIQFIDAKVAENAAA